MLKQFFFSLIIVCIIHYHIFGYYGYLPDNMPLFDAITICAHNAQSVSELGWNIPNHYGTFYDLLKKYGVRHIDLRVHLGTDEAVALSPFYEIGNFFSNLFSGQNPFKPRKKPLALLTCHENEQIFPINQNCQLTRSFLKCGIPTKLNYFLQEIEQFLTRNPSEFVMIFLGCYITENLTSDVNGWKGTSTKQIIAFLDTLIENSGLSKRIAPLPSSSTNIGELRGKVIFFADQSIITESSKYVKHTIYQLFKIQKWNTFPQSIYNNTCPLITSSSAPGLIAILAPNVPLDLALISGKKVRECIQFLTGKIDIVPYNFATEVNTEHNIRAIIEICSAQHSTKVSAVNLDFVSKGSPKIPAAIIFDINKERLQKSGKTPYYDNFESFVATLK